MVRDRGSNDYPTFWGIVEKDGCLLVCPLTARDWQPAEEQLLRETIDDPVQPRAVVRFTHPAYSQPQNAQEFVVDMILEEAARALDMPAAIAAA